PLDVFYLNFSENLRIAEACVRRGKRLIQFSSCEVYGKTPAGLWPDKLIDPEDPSWATFTEDSSPFVLGPVNKHRWIYACAKQLLERVLHAFGLEGRLNYTVIRPFNIIGPKIDYLPSITEGVPRVFSYFMEALLTGGEMKLVGDGTHRRCYTYVEDSIDCLMRIVENEGGVCDREIFNIGSPYNEISIKGLAELMNRIYADKFRPPGAGLPRIVSVPPEDFYGLGYDDSDRRIPDISKARRLLNWEPKTGLSETLERTMAYYVDECTRRSKESGFLAPGPA
ncbi:MAG: NAD-dependent epimerase/dehydratase family protein, partial [Pseudomonadota bacterium]